MAKDNIIDFPQQPPLEAPEMPLKFVDMDEVARYEDDVAYCIENGIDHSCLTPPEMTET